MAPHAVLEYKCTLPQVCGLRLNAFIQHLVPWLIHYAYAWFHESYTCTLFQFGNVVNLSTSQWLSYLLKSVNYITKLFDQIVNAIQGDKQLPTTFFIPAFASPKGMYSIELHV